MKFERDMTPIGRPPGTSRRSVQGGNLVTIIAFDITGPYIPKAQAVGFERNLLPVRRQLRTHLVTLLQDHRRWPPDIVFCILQVESPDIEFGFSLLVNQGVALRRNGRPRCLADWAGHRPRFTTGCRDSPQTRRGTSVGRENYFTAVGGPGGRAHDRPVVKSQAFGVPARGGHNEDVITNARYRRSDKSQLASVGRECRLVIEPACGR